MASRTKEYLKGRFENGTFPTEDDFADVIDSAINKQEEVDQVVPDAPAAGHVPSTQAVKGYVAGEVANLPSREDVNKLDASTRKNTSRLDGVVEEIKNLRQVTVEGDVVNNPDNEDLVEENGVLKLKNRTTSVAEKGYVILRVGSAAGQMSATNTIYEVRYAHDLAGGTLNIPEGSTLKFNGGCFRNGTLNGANTAICAGMYRIFDDIHLTGTWAIDGLNVHWFGAKNGGASWDNTPYIQAAIDNAMPKTADKDYGISCPVYLGKGAYHCHATIRLEQASLFGVSEHRTTIMFLPSAGVGILCTNKLAAIKDMTLEESGNGGTVVLLRLGSYYIDNEGNHVMQDNAANVSDYFSIQGCFENLRLNKGRIGMDLNHQWCNKISRITAKHNSIGIRCYDTTPYLENVVVEGNTECGILCPIGSSGVKLYNAVIENNYWGLIAEGGSLDSDGIIEDKGEVHLESVYLEANCEMNFAGSINDIEYLPDDAKTCKNGGHILAGRHGHLRYLNMIGCHVVNGNYKHYNSTILVDKCRNFNMVGCNDIWHLVTTENCHFGTAVGTQFDTGRYAACLLQTVEFSSSSATPVFHFRSTAWEKMEKSGSTYYLKDWVDGGNIRSNFYMSGSYCELVATDRGLAIHSEEDNSAGRFELVMYFRRTLFDRGKDLCLLIDYEKEENNFAKFEVKMSKNKGAGAADNEGLEDVTMGTQASSRQGLRRIALHARAAQLADAEYVYATIYMWHSSSPENDLEEGSRFLIRSISLFNSYKAWDKSVNDFELPAIIGCNYMEARKKLIVPNLSPVPDGVTSESDSNHPSNVPISIGYDSTVKSVVPYNKAGSPIFAWSNSGLGTDLEAKYKGASIFNSVSGFNYPVWFDGTKWVQATGRTASPAGTGTVHRLSGTTAQRPSKLEKTGVDVGYMYFDTTVGKPIWWTGSGWVDATGVAV